MPRVRNLKIIYEELRGKLKVVLRRPNKNLDYSSETLIDYIVTKTMNYSKKICAGAFTPEAYRTIAAIGMLPPDMIDLDVIDFGGGAGSHFSVSKKAFPNKKFNWLIIETPEMVRICQEKGLNEILFARTIEEARDLIPTPDLIVLNASIHYAVNPLEVLKSLCELNARWIFITRTPLSLESNTLELLQESKLSKNGPGPYIELKDDTMIIVPIQVVPKQSLECILLEKYTILLKFEEESLYANSKARSLKTFGYFCELSQ